MTLFWIHFAIHFQELCIHFVTLYDIEQCTVNYRREKESKKWSFKKFLNHPLKQYRKQCGQSLMKSVKSLSGKSILLPLKTYCCRSLKKSLELLLSRDGFEIVCEKWSNLEKDSEVLRDVYDGNIWKTFSSNVSGILKKSEILLLCSMLTDSSHLSSFSVLGIYLVILNLLRTERFK